MSLAWESELGVRSMTWLDVYDFASDGNLLMLSITLNIESLEADFLLASIVEFLKSARTSNRQILKSNCKSIQE